MALPKSAYKPGHKHSDETKAKISASNRAVRNGDPVVLNPLVPLANTEIDTFEQEMPTWVHTVIELRAKNIAWGKIAKQLDMTIAQVQDAWASKMNELRILDPKIVDAYRVEDLETIDEVLRQLKEELASNPGNPNLIKVLGEWHDRRVKLLGTVAPERRQVDVVVTATFEERLKALDSMKIIDVDYTEFDDDDE